MPTKVYPRACGGTRTTHRTRVARSIPARAGEPGNPRACGGTGIGVRGSIPARAGEPWRRSRCPRGSRSIPARAGEPTGDAFRLSPRVRGNLCQGLRPGSIPARAGEPTFLPRSRRSLKVYPRACGGTGSIRSGVRDWSGLSPRVRGNLNPWRMSGFQRGSIPARAGEPGRVGVRAWVHEVYPRACGGTQHQGGHDDAHQGLSPRVRGNRGACRTGEGGRGSIPARAGEPPSATRTN